MYYTLKATEKNSGCEVFIRVHNLDDFVHADSEQDVSYYIVVEGEEQNIHTGFTSKKNLINLEVFDP
jgi:hypothetical protein